jgi:hypothetical protein
VAEDKGFERERESLDEETGKEGAGGEGRRGGREDVRSTASGCGGRGLNGDGVFLEGHLLSSAHQRLFCGGGVTLRSFRSEVDIDPSVGWVTERHSHCLMSSHSLPSVHHV